MSEFYTQLSEAIFGHPSFQSDLRHLRVWGAKRAFPGELLKSKLAPIQLTNFKRLLESAIVFSLSPKPEHRKIAYEVAIVALDTMGAEYPELKNVVSVIFSRLSNFPANELLKKKAIDPLDNKPLLINMECAIKETLNTVDVDGVPLPLTDFQKRFWHLLQGRKSIALSAPTSAGKSFILKRHLLGKIGEGTPLKVLYMVPSRALISEVSLEIAGLLKKHNFQNYTVLTAPLKWEDQTATPLYVLTPERTNVLLDSNPDIKMDMAIIDEAQKISDRQRGTIFHNSIEKIFEHNPDTQFLFSMPNISNPLMFSSNVVGIQACQEINEVESPVGKNIFLLYKRAKGTKVGMRVGNSVEEIGLLENLQIADLAKQKTADYARLIGDGAQNIIYAHYPATCVEIADNIISKLEPLNSEHPDLRELTKYIAETLHPACSLVKTVPYGVAYHCGYLPSPIRLKLEHLFKSGAIRHLVCTSTLLEGVNLPAKNIFIHNATKVQADFRNLTGRAGRLTKDFEGNVFITQPQDFTPEQILDDAQASISPAIYTEIENELDKVLIALESIENADNAYAISANKIYSEYKKGQIDVFLGKSPRPVPEGSQKRIKVALQKLDAQVTLPWTIIQSNPYFTPLSQVKLHEYIESRFVESVIPGHPLQKNNNFELIAGILNEKLNLFHSVKHLKYIQVLARDWLTEKPFKAILTKQIEYYSDESPEKIIHNTLNTIEQEIRFRLSVAFKCFIDILIHNLGDDPRKESIYAIPLALELGACNWVTINLITLGFSRYAAIELQRIPQFAIPNAETHVLRMWLKENRAHIEKSVAATIREEFSRLA